MKPVLDSIRHGQWLYIILSLILVACANTPTTQVINAPLENSTPFPNGTPFPNSALSLPMGYVANVQFSPFYVGVSEGYFKDAGYELSFDYRWETDGIRLVAAGQIPFTLASGDQVIQARSQGLPVVAVAAWYQRFPVAIIALENIPLNTPADLRGLRIGIPETFGASYIGLRALLEAGELTESDIKLQTIGYTQLAALTAQTVDAVVVYANNEPVILGQTGTPFNALYVADYADIMSAVIVTNDTMVTEHPAEVQAFVKAFLKGLEATLADPDAAFEASKIYIEGLEENAIAQRAVLETTLTYWRASELGKFQKQAWENSLTVMLNAGLVETAVPVEDLFTNAFVE
ncbi:MAG: ABC transporter substrate-binding protein [Anaerolineae bacterium]|nr:ABC transporter substrate-binding protein [Anaerolineae bacterium]